MIHSKQELRFYIYADRIMAGLTPNRSMFEKVVTMIGITSLSKGGGISEYLKFMRRVCYYQHIKHPSIIERLCKAHAFFQYKRLGRLLGFSIGADVFGYGLLIPHYGTIVVNNNCQIGNFCVLHTSTCIGGESKIIGDGLYLSSGAKIMGQLTLGNGVSVAANSLVNKSAPDSVLLAGLPATIKRENYPTWYVRDGEEFLKRVKRIEQLRKEMNL